MNLFVPVTPQLANLGDDVRGGATLLTPARIRHDAVSTELVTAFDDWDKRDVLRCALSRGHIPDFTFMTFIQVDYATFAIERSGDQLRQPIRRARARDYVNRRRVIKNCRP